MNSKGRVQMCLNHEESDRVSADGIIHRLIKR